MSEKHQPKPDRLEEAIEAFQRMTVPDRPPDEKVLTQLGSARGDSVQSVSISSPSKRRYLMRFLVPSAAAALLLLGVLSLLFMNATPSIALADVVQAAEKHKLVRFKEKQTHANGPTVERTVHADLKALRLRIEGSSFVQINDGPNDLVLWYNASQKTARLSRLWIQVTPQGTEPIPEKDRKLKPLLDQLREFQHKEGVTSVRDKLGDRETVKYRWEKEEGGGKQSISLWVDAKTKLPVQMENELIMGDFQSTQLRTDFAWDPELPKGFKNLDELFSTCPPEGYKLDNQTK